MCQGGCGREKKLLQQKEDETVALRGRLDGERQAKTEALTRLEESEKHFKEEVQRFEIVWNELSETFKAMGEGLDAAKKEYDTLVTARVNMLEKPLRKIDEIGRQKAVTSEKDLKLDEIS